MNETPKSPEDSGSGGSPLARRVDRLEEDMTEIKTLLREQQRILIDIQVKLATMDGRITGLESRFTGLEGRMTGLEGRMTRLEAQFAGLDAKISALPSTWTILGLVFTTWAIGSGILIFAMNFFRP
jgi:uncharacterized coiled-coil protein SlyX